MQLPAETRDETEGQIAEHCDRVTQDLPDDVQHSRLSPRHTAGRKTHWRSLRLQWGGPDVKGEDALLQSQDDAPGLLPIVVKCSCVDEDVGCGEEDARERKPEAQGDRG